MPKIKQIHHVAIVVEDIDSSLAFWHAALGLELNELRDVPVEKSKIAFLPVAGGEIELVQPTSADSGIAKYLAKRGQGMHHICLEVDDIEETFRELSSRGITPEAVRVDEITGKRFFFISDPDGLPLEFYEK